MQRKYKNVDFWRFKAVYMYSGLIMVLTDHE